MHLYIYDKKIEDVIGNAIHKENLRTSKKQAHLWGDVIQRLLNGIEPNRFIVSLERVKPTKKQKVKKTISEFLNEFEKCK